MEPSKQDFDALESLETELWCPETRHDRKRMDQVFASDFFEIGRSGRIHSREQLINTDGKPFAARIPLLNLTVRLLTSEVAQVTYNSAVTVNGAVQWGRRSSIWSRQSGSWKLRYHQGTPYNGE